MMPWILLLLAALPGPQGCLPVPGDRILAADLARAVPSFSQVPGDLPMGFAPAAGARRTYGPAELARLARRYGLTVEPGAAACFARPVSVLSLARVAAALGMVLPAAGLEVLDFSHQPVPPGELRFDRPAEAAGNQRLCHGVIFRTGQADFPVWARVRVRTPAERAIAAETLAPGKIILSTQIRAGTGGRPPDLSQVVGRVPRRSIPAGTPIQPGWLEDAPDVANGGRVEVEVRCGQARLLFEGQAKSSGRRGQVIPVRNPENGKIFNAIVRDRGRVTLAADGTPEGTQGEIH